MWLRSSRYSRSAAGSAPTPDADSDRNDADSPRRCSTALEPEPEPEPEVLGRGLEMRPIPNMPCRSAAGFCSCEKKAEDDEQDDEKDGDALAAAGADAEADMDPSGARKNRSLCSSARNAEKKLSTAVVHATAACESLTEKGVADSHNWIRCGNRPRTNGQPKEKRAKQMRLK
jgi:hypothetical protein